jgi:hypothetical protein
LAKPPELPRWRFPRSAGRGLLQDGVILPHGNPCHVDCRVDAHHARASSRGEACPDGIIER